MPDPEEWEPVVYYFDTASIVTEVANFSVCFSWQELLEELSHKEIAPHVVMPSL